MSQKINTIIDFFLLSEVTPHCSLTRMVAGDGGGPDWAPQYTVSQERIVSCLSTVILWTLTVLVTPTASVIYGWIWCGVVKIAFW